MDGRATGDKKWLRLYNIYIYVYYHSARLIVMIATWTKFYNPSHFRRRALDMISATFTCSPVPTPHSTWALARGDWYIYYNFWLRNGMCRRHANRARVDVFVAWMREARYACGGRHYCFVIIFILWIRYYIPSRYVVDISYIPLVYTFGGRTAIRSRRARTQPA